MLGLTASEARHRPAPIEGQKEDKMKEILGGKTLKHVKTILLCYMVPLALVLCFMNSASANYFAGYYYLASAGSPPSNGVSASIYTINPTVTGNQMMMQWPMVIISYTYMYYTQIGYWKGDYTNYALEYFWQTTNSSGFFGGNSSEQSGPAAGSTHGYSISKSNSDTHWSLYVDGTLKYTSGPTTVVDYQAFSETTTTAIVITNTHFNYLEYKQVNDWNLWDRHVNGSNTPSYTVNQISNYEFTASGGG